MSMPDQYILFILSNDLNTNGFKYRLKNDEPYLECKIVTFPLRTLSNFRQRIEEEYQIIPNTIDFLENDNKIVITTSDYNKFEKEEKSDKNKFDNLPTFKLEDKEVEAKVLQILGIKTTKEILDLNTKKDRAEIQKERGETPKDPFELKDEVYLAKLQSMATIIKEYSQRRK